MSEEPKNNRCEICNLQATAGIIDSKNKLRFTCGDHAMKLFERIAHDSKK